MAERLPLRSAHESTTLQQPEGATVFATEDSLRCLLPPVASTATRAAAYTTASTAHPTPRTFSASRSKPLIPAPHTIAVRIACIVLLDRHLGMHSNCLFVCNDPVGVRIHPGTIAWTFLDGRIRHRRRHFGHLGGRNWSQLGSLPVPCPHVQAKSYGSESDENGCCNYHRVTHVHPPIPSSFPAVAVTDGHLLRSK